MDDSTKVNIFLIRHGEKSKDGLSLTKRGKKQAQLIGKRLKKHNIKKIYSSDIPRCKATTEIISKYTKNPIIYDKSLREVHGYVKENPKKYSKEINKIKRFYNKIGKSRLKNILLVGSGNVNRILIAIALKINPKNSRFTQNPTGLTHLEYINKNKTRIVCVNDTNHLPNKLNKRQAH